MGIFWQNNQTNRINCVCFFEKKYFKLKMKLAVIYAIFWTILQINQAFGSTTLRSKGDLSPECERLVGRKRIRKEVNRLTPMEKFHLNFALKLAMASAPHYLKNKGAQNKLLFGDIANYHGAPYTICNGRPCCPHSDRLPEFLVWHRLYTVQLEELLEPYLKDTDLGLPYWDWTKNATIPDLWEDVFSPIKEFNNTDFDGPLRFADLSQCQSQFPDQPLESHALRIKPEFNIIPNQRSRLENSMDSVLEADDFMEFSRHIEAPHSNIHVFLGCTMQFVETAAYDPIFWLHHSYVDKVWAERQDNQELLPMTNSELGDTILRPFEDPNHNPFKLTNKTQKQALNYEENLCYCYDCDLEQSTLAIGSQDPFIETKEIVLPDGTTFYQKDRFYKVKSYVGLEAPKHIGGKILTYKICYENNCTFGKTGLFGTLLQPENVHVQIDKSSMTLHENLNSRNDRNIYNAVQWLSLDVSEDDSNAHLVVPMETPLFMVIEITNGIEHTQFAQLNYGVSRETYGNLLEDFVVLDYCSTFTWDKVKGQEWKIGHPDICGWNPKDLTAFLPITILNLP